MTLIRYETLTAGGISMSNHIKFSMETSVLTIYCTYIINKLKFELWEDKRQVSNCVCLECLLP